MTRLDPTHIFAGDPLDRADQLRRDSDWVKRQLSDKHTRVLPFWRTKVLTRIASQSTLGWETNDVVRRYAATGDTILLGLAEGAAHFTVDVSHADDPKTEFKLSDDTKFIDPRSIAPDLPLAQSGTLAHAKSLVEWHARHRFCANCGAGTRVNLGGKERVCDSCEAHHFPRTDPVAIMVVHHGNRCLLGRSHRGTGSYSALAGFIDQGETIEEAVRREVLEEAGITVGAVRYHSSQPWPYPSSLMIGCIGEALDDTLVIDDQELADVQWFERESVAEALHHPDRRDLKLQVPGPIAIAHHLLKAWLAGD